jgi:hypothetical protein
VWVEDAAIRPDRRGKGGAGLAISVHQVPSPKFNVGHPAPYVAIVHHRMVGTLKSTDTTFTTGSRQASTTFGIGSCSKHANDGVCIHQYVRIGDQHWGNGNWDATGTWNDTHPVTHINSRTISIEHEDNGGKKRGKGKGVVTEAIIKRSIELDRLLLSGNVAAMKKAGIAFRAGTQAKVATELRAIKVSSKTILTHHDIAGRLKPSCWLPWEDDKVGFPRARYVSELSSGAPVAAVASSPAAAPVKPKPKPGKVDMPVFKTFARPKIASVPKGAWIYDNAGLKPSAGNIQLNPGRDLPVAGVLPSGVLIVGYRDTTPTEDQVPTYYFKGTPKDYVAP